MTRMSARIPHQLEKFAGLRLEPPRFSESLEFRLWQSMMHCLVRHTRRLS